MALESDRAEQEGVNGESPDVVTARRRFREAMDAEDENRTRERDDMKFLASTPDDNYQWPLDVLRQRQQPGQEGGIRPCLTINKLRSHQRQVTNEQKMNRPQIIARPADSKASMEVAKVLNGWLRHIQVASEADLAYDTAFEWATGGGEGFFRMYCDYADEMSFEQEVIFEACPDRFKVYLDPIGLMQHPAGKKCQWGFIVEDLHKDDYEALYGEDNPIEWNLAGTADQVHWFPTKEMVRVAEYFEIKQTPKTICEWLVPMPVQQSQPQPQPQAQPGMQPGQPMPQQAPQPPAVELVKTVTIKGSPEDAKYTKAGYKKTGERKTKIARCIWRKMNGQKVIAGPKEMPTRYLPIIRVIGNQFVVDGKLLVDGMVRPAKDAQRMYNYNASKEIEVNALQPIAPITAMIEQIKGHEDKYRQANTTGYAYLPYNAVYNEDGTIAVASPPQRIAPPVPSAAILQAKMGADQDIKATMGQWGPSLGEPSGEQTGKAINARKTESDVGSFHYVDNLARALRYAGTIALDMASEIIDSKRIVRILGEDDEPDHITVDPDLPVPYMETTGPDGKKQCIYNFSIGKYEVVVNTGPSFTSKRAEAAEFMTTAVQSAKDPATANVLTYLAMKNQDWAGAEEAVTLLKALLPPPAQQALAAESDDSDPISPETQAAMDQLKGTVGNLGGQLDAAKQALAERDQQLQQLNAQLKGKSQDALAKVYESDMRTLAEITKARADLLIAQADAAKVGAQTGSMDVSALNDAMAHAIAEIDSKLQGLSDHAAAIKGQLDNFEVASALQQQQPDMSQPAPDQTGQLQGEMPQ